MRMTAANDFEGCVRAEDGCTGLAVRIDLGRTHLPAVEALAMGAGDLVELDAPVEDFANIYANGRLVARGEMAELNGKFCVRIREVIAERPRSLSTDLSRARRA